MAAMSVSLLFLLIALLLVVGLILGIIMWATSGSKGATGEMSCGRCGYHVRGLSQLNCPECGADLREAGIQPIGNPGKRTMGMVLTICCGGVLLLGCGLSGLAFVGFKSVSAPPSMQSVPTLPAPSTNSSTSLQPASPAATDPNEGAADEDEPDESDNPPETP